MADDFAGFRDLAAMSRWCAWKREPARGGRMARVPYVLPERRGSVKKPQHWLTLEHARGLSCVFQDQNAQAGVGILLGPLPDGRRLVALDLDACRCSETGVVAPWAEAILAAFAGAYCETSPSGGGVHVVFLLRPGEATDAVLAGLGRARTTWKRPAAEGEKAAAIEVLTGGYVTVTGAPMLGSPPRVSEHDPAPLAWLVRGGGPAFRDGVPPQGTPQASARSGGGGSTAEPAACPAEPAAGERQASKTPPMFRASPERLRRHAEERTDCEFQLLASLWAWGRKGRPGWMRASVPSTRLLELPGEPSRRRASAPGCRGALPGQRPSPAADGCGRSSATLARSRKALLKAGLLVQAAAPVVPGDRRAGRAAEYEVAAPMVATAGLPASDRPEVLRMPREAWQSAVWSLPPAALRILAWVWATQRAGEFSLSARDLASTLRALDRESAPGSLATLVAGGWLDEVSPPSARRAGRYAPGRLLRGEEE